MHVLTKPEQNFNLVEKIQAKQTKLATLVSK